MKLNAETISDGLCHIYKSDKTLRKFKRIIVELPLPSRDFSFESFVRVVINQQLSDKAANTILGRVNNIFDEEISPSIFLSTDEDTLRSCGVSFQKIGYLKNIAQIFLDDPSFLNTIKNGGKEDTFKILTSIKGLGPWSAGIIQLFYVGDTDTMIFGDVTINKVLGKLYHLNGDVLPSNLDKISEKWKPYRAVGCLLCWHLNDFSHLD